MSQAFADRLKTSAIVVHCSATKASVNWRAADLRASHLKRGFSDIGYGLVICRDGLIEPGRPLTAVGAHVQGRNHDTLGVCLVGGLDEEGKPACNFTKAQWRSLIVARQFLMAMYPQATWCGHRDLSPDQDGDGRVERHEWLKDCPCFDVGEWVRQGCPVGGPAEASSPP